MLFGIRLHSMGDCGFNFCLLHTVFPSRGAFLAEMAGQQIGLNGREDKLALMAGQKVSSKEICRGH